MNCYFQASWRVWSEDLLLLSCLKSRSLFLRGLQIFIWVTRGEYSQLNTAKGVSLRELAKCQTKLHDRQEYFSIGLPVNFIARCWLCLFCCWALLMPMASFAVQPETTQPAQAHPCHDEAPAASPVSPPVSHNQAIHTAACADCMICAGVCLPPPVGGLQMPLISVSRVTGSSLTVTLAGLNPPPELKPPRS